jgi:hypothetical protein
VQINLGVFSADLSEPTILMFSIIEPLFQQQQKKPLYPNSKYLFGIGI